MSEWECKKIGNECQLSRLGVNIRVDGYEYDGHPDYLWIGLSFRGEMQVELKGEQATNVMSKLSVNGVKGELFKEKKYQYLGFD